jgi:4'-phosphopantetheinyl transferase
MFEVSIITVNPELTQEEYDVLLPFVSAEKQERIKKFHFFRDARNCLLGDVLVRAEICRHTGFNNSQLEFSSNEYGKPFLTNDDTIHFNISHAGDYIACVVADEPVGIDVELVKLVDMKIAERFFTADENTYIIEETHLDRFYEVWTMKESYAKWEGKGLYRHINSFSVFEVSGNETVVFHEVFRNDEAICSVCSKIKLAPSIKLLNTTTFVENFIQPENYYS